ncbi:hypothetical protein REPUB_Repub09cG0068700 [Reevesia pubescens]
MGGAAENYFRFYLKEVLAKRGVLSWDSTYCLFCCGKVESVELLFFTCDFSWQIWATFFSTWGIYWVAHNDSICFFTAWQNDLVFNGKTSNLLQLVDLIKIRLASWFTAKWSDSIVVSWAPPPASWMKFSVDGASRGNPGLSSI